VINEFFAMGGYGFYVWSSFGLSLFGLLLIYFAAKRFEKRKRSDIALWIKSNK